MESFFSRFKNALVLIAILFVQTLALATQLRRPESAAAQAPPADARQVRLIRVWALAVVTPFERMFTGTGHGMRSAWTNYLDLRHVRQQNLDLQKQLAGMRLERAALAEDALEGQRLERLLDFKQHYIASTVAAQVIGTSGSDAGRTLILNKGANDGLRPDMAVLTPDGVVGKLRMVSASTAQLLLLSDPSSGAGVLLQSTRIRAVVRGGAGGRLEIANLTADDRIKPGETVLTSGGDQVYPRGLPVGTIVSIVPDPEHQPYTAILLRPAADLNRLDEVLVVTALGTTLPAEAQQELSADAAAHAADGSGDRLPSLREAPGAVGSPGPDAPPPANNSTDLVPKPKPVNHPDKYTSGAAPPAADLTPGAPR